MLKRKAYEKLLEWKSEHEKTCLMILGARQVGKTYLVREFGKNEYKSFIDINFINNEQFKYIFDSNLDAETIFKRMSVMIADLKLIEHDTLIFLDEIQYCGNARTALKFLAEDGRYDVIASGSLLGLTYAENGDKNVEMPISIPVGYEEFMTLYSLDFEEFLWSEGYDENAISYLKEFYDKKEMVPKAINEKYEELFREYMVVGGMPEVVSDYCKNHDLNRVHRIQSKIINDYKLDITKHAKGAEKVKVSMCYDAIPKQLAKEQKKFQYSTVEKGQTKKKYGNSVKWLVDSCLVNECCNTKEPYIPLLANSVDDQYKLYVNDTGLLCCIYGIETKRLLLTNGLKGNAKGGICENIIAESLVKRGYKIYYYKPDENNELEFLIEKNCEVVPLEIKAGNNSSVSLNRFIERYKPSCAYKIINGNIGVVDKKITLPHYMIMFL